jgi:hypothetical protein
VLDFSGDESLWRILARCVNVYLFVARIAEHHQIVELVEFVGFLRRVRAWPAGFSCVDVGYIATISVRSLSMILSK